MNNWQNKVKEFHEKFGLENHLGDLPSIRSAELRKKLIEEECNETLKAIKNNDLVETVDGLCDLIYVCLGAAVTFGIDLDPFFDLVHESNMKKEDGSTRADGKLLKPEGWVPPDIAGELRRQIKGMTTNDPVNSPKHYRQGGMEVIDIIEAFELDYRLGNTIKYVLRHSNKGKPLEDLKKARYYLDRQIRKLEKESK